MNIKAAYMVPHPPLIVPEIGRGQEAGIQATITSYQTIAKEIHDLNPDTIIIVSPHSVMYADYFHISPGTHAKGNFAQFHAKQVSFDVDYDAELTEKLQMHTNQIDFPAGTLGERDANLDHATMVPLYFLQQAYGGQFPCKFVRIGLSGLSFEMHYQLGQMIMQTADELNRSIVFIASGDLSHRLKEDGPYGYQKEGPVYDHTIMEYASHAEFNQFLLMKEDFCELAGECGQRSFCMMAGVLEGIAVEAKQLSYEGPFGVGYGVVSFHPTGYDPKRKFLDQVVKEKKHIRADRKANEDVYVRLARKSLESYVADRKKIAIPEDLPKELLNQTAGCFVSLKKNGKLRGCIGTIAATKQSLADEIIENAISAAVKDPRFEPVQTEELEELEYSVDVLGKAERISSPEELDVKKYGVIVTKGYKRGLLLPNLDGVDSVTQQIHIAKQKAGISDSEDVTLERFEVVRHY